MLAMCCGCWRGLWSRARQRSTVAGERGGQHEVVSRWETEGRLVGVVGDVHGCWEELVELLGRMEAYSRERGKEMEVIFVGDLVGKGPESGRVVRHIREMESVLPLRKRCVMGNHDDYLLSFANSPEKLASEHEYAKIARGMEKEDLKFLSGMPLSLFVEEHNVLIVHAGLLPGTKPQDNSPNDLMNARDVAPAQVKDGVSYPARLISKPGREQVSGSEPWASKWAGPEHVVFGHDALRKLQTYPYATGLDTGCCYGGKLTALILNTKDLIQVDARAVYKTPGL